MVVKPKLFKTQCGFCYDCNTTDAMFVLHQLANMAELTDNIQFHMAFINLTKAYDWVNMDALWWILCIYKVPSRIVQLLEDLHVGTFATLGLGGRWAKNSLLSATVCAKVVWWRLYCSMFSWTL
jgi:hypothetical protein